MIFGGQILARIPAKDFTRLMKSRATRKLSRFRITPLFETSYRAGLRDPAGDGTGWIVLQSDAGRNPWDLAHDAVEGRPGSFAAMAGLKEIYAEPDIQHPAVAATDKDGLDDKYPPYPPVYPNPAWHLDHCHTNFFSAWKKGITGKGVRIAHLDTGYYSGPAGLHFAAPRNLKTKLGWNFVESPLPQNAIDPGVQGILLQPWHGTATMALLAGGTIDWTTPAGQFYKGDIGAAPDADVIPVRISSTVILLFTSGLAKGLDYALAPGLDAANRCHVVSLSMGGLPSLAWAAAVNRLYRAGVVVAAASGDNINVEGIGIPTTQTVWPARFKRVISVNGATYDRTPYIAVNDMQGSWGPDGAMKGKAITAFSPNTFHAAINYDINGENPMPSFGMDFAGTSASTPQVAAACALWLGQHGQDYPAGPKRVEACRAALMLSAVPGDSLHFGSGILDVAKLFDAATKAKVDALHKKGRLLPAAEADISGRFLNQVFGSAARGSPRKMYDVEAAQLLAATVNPKLAQHVAEFDQAKTVPPSLAAQLRTEFLGENMSGRLRAHLQPARKTSGRGR